MGWSLVILAILFFLSSLFVLFFVIMGILALFVTRVPSVNVPAKKYHLIFKNLKIKPGDRFYDLGSGSGKVLLEAERYGLTPVGFELSLLPYLATKLRILSELSKAEVHLRNFYRIKLKDADIIYCFLVDKVMPEVKSLIKRKAKKGTQVVSYGFSFPGWRPRKIVKTDPTSKTASKIYFYKV